MVYKIKQTQLKQLIEETGLNEIQIDNYRRWLRGAGIFPSHKLYKDGQYSKEEVNVLRQIGKYVQEYRIIDSVKLSLKDIYGKDSLQLEDFVSWWGQFLKEQSSLRKKTRKLKREIFIKENLNSNNIKLTSRDYDTIIQMYDNGAYPHLSKLRNIISEKLVTDFLSLKKDMFKSYPLDLYFAIFPSERGCITRTYIKSKFRELISDSAHAQTFNEYEKNVFDAYIYSFNEIIKKVAESFKVALEKLHKENERKAEIIEKRYVQHGKLRSLEIIGEELGITRERVRQLEDKGIKILKTYTEINDLATELFSGNGVI